MRILDLFCGSGGSAWGYHQAFPEAEIVGVDIAPQPSYPFRFEQGDAMTFPLSGYDLIHASPPCQGYSVMRHLPWNRDRIYPLLIEPIRQRLRSQPVPWVIENVMGAQKAARMGAGWLCGTMFGLPIYRHRVFESSFAWLSRPHARHEYVIRAGRMLGSRADTPVCAGPARPGRDVERWPSLDWGLPAIDGGPKRVTRERIGAAMGIDWMTRREMRQAIPPAYTRYIARWVPGFAAAE